jgi:2,3-bisphosphoglycerate-independent phosphoglycerate mutase
MSALEITEHCISYVHTDHPDFICLNYANPDMVGHTGDFDAVVKACEVVDSYTEKLCKELLQSDYQIIIIADHGNADYMRNEDGTPNTAHSLALVPCFLL